MTFFVDANVVLYCASASRYRGPCLEVLRAIGSGDADGRTSPAALEEVWHIEASGRGGRLDGHTRRAYLLFAPLLSITDEVFQLALSLETATLGTNDRLHAATCMANDIEVIVSADSGFDAVPGLRRVDPLDERARRCLVG